MITDSEKKHLLVEMMEKLQKYLDEKDINFFFAYGSLIGVVRHHGFIPWDDDIDILIPRGDFIRLIHIIENDILELEKMNLAVIDYNGHIRSYHKRFKIADTRTIMKEFGKDRPAVFIDIFPIDFFSNRMVRKISRRIVLCVDNLLVLCHSGYVTQSGAKGVMYKILLLLHKAAGLNRMEHLYERMLIRLNKYTFNGVACSSEAEFGEKQFSPAQCYSGSVILPFERLQVPCPIGYDSILTSIYGDYMILPPMNKRRAHDKYEMYWKE